MKYTIELELSGENTLGAGMTLNSYEEAAAIMNEMVWLNEMLRSRGQAPVKKITLTGE